MRSVFSSNVSEVGYDPETQELHVRWQNGKLSIYSGVPADTADGVMNAASVGGALNDEIKGTFPHRYGA
jgi:hypothetical protein